MKTKAATLVEAQYGIDEASMETPEIKALVSILLEKKAFVFEHPDTVISVILVYILPVVNRILLQRQNIYRHPIILKLISIQWFKGPSSEAAGIYAPAFNPIPLPLIALVATAVSRARMCIVTS